MAFPVVRLDVVPGRKTHPPQVFRQNAWHHLYPMRSARRFAQQTLDSQNNSEKSPVEPSMIQETTYLHPRELRERRLLRGRLRSDRLPVFEIVIRNISTRGLCATCRELPPLPGETCEIELPDNRRVGATVRWGHDQVFGLAFDAPIDLEAMFMTLQRLRDLAERNASWEVKSKHRVINPRPDLARLRRV